MIERHERRALPARLDIGAPKVADDIDARARGEQRALSKLHGAPLLGTVQHRLTVKADDVDGGRGKLRQFEELAHHRRVGFGQEKLDLAEPEGHGRALRPSARFGHGRAQKRRELRLEGAR